jgi:hypothetical protein
MVNVKTFIILNTIWIIDIEKTFYKLEPMNNNNKNNNNNKKTTTKNVKNMQRFVTFWNINDVEKIEIEFMWLKYLN